MSFSFMPVATECNRGKVVVVVKGCDDMRTIITEADPDTMISQLREKLFRGENIQFYPQKCSLTPLAESHDICNICPTHENGMLCVTLFHRAVSMTEVKSLEKDRGADGKPTIKELEEGFVGQKCTLENSYREQKEGEPRYPSMTPDRPHTGVVTCIREVNIDFGVENRKSKRHEVDFEGGDVYTTWNIYQYLSLVSE